MTKKKSIIGRLSNQQEKPLIKTEYLSKIIFKNWVLNLGLEKRIIDKLYIQYDNLNSN